MRSLIFIVLFSAFTMSCNPAEEPKNMQQKELGLKEALEGDFYIGTAINPSQHNESDKAAVSLIKKHFNTITPENVMKWENIHPEADNFDFSEADKFVEFGEENDMFIVGHTLVWHSQTPEWVFQDEDGNPLSREALLERMQNHIQTVVGRYKGKVDGWDVVNEAVNDDGTVRESSWYNIIGEDYVAKAFQFAHEADPDAELYYNDYNLHLADKADAAAKLVKSVQDQEIHVTGIGMQGHYGLDYPSEEQLNASIKKFGELGSISITELDMDVLPSSSGYTGADVSERNEFEARLNPYTEGLPDSVVQLQTEQYRKFFKVFLENKDVINRVTLWGVRDGDSWKNNWPIPGRTNYPLLFDRKGNPKPVVEEIKKLAGNSSE